MARKAKMERDIIITNMDKSSEIPQGKPEGKRTVGVGRRANPQEAKERLDFIKRKAEAFKGEVELPFSDALRISRTINDINQDKDVLITSEELTGFKKTAEQIFDRGDVAKMEPAQVLVAAHDVLARSVVSKPEEADWEYSVDVPVRREEEASAREQIAKAKEAKLDPQKAAEHLEVIQEKIGKASKKSGPGTMQSAEWWEEGLPPETELSETLKNHINVIKMVSQSGRVSKQVFDDLESAKNNILTEMQRGGLVGDRNAEALWVNVSERQRLLLGVLTEQSSDKDPAMIKGQKLMYGMTTIPKSRELKEFLEENKTSNLAVLFATPEFKGEDIGKYEGFFPADLVKHKVEPVKEDREYAEKLKFHNYYKALKKDQEAWVHETLNRLPLQDISREALQSDINYREFGMAQPDMILEVAEYARALDYAYSAKYIFYSNGAKALGQFANLLTKSYYTLATKAPGWAEVVNEIENMAEARYRVERDSSGLVVSAKPKTESELIKERKDLGKDKWKIGGLVQHDHEDLDTIRTHLIDGVKEVIAQKLGLNETKDAKEIESRAKIAAFLGEWLGWRMAGRSAHWGEQGKEGYAGENAHFKVINFQRYANQEDKGHREMRQMLFGTDNIKDMIYGYAPGQAGGLNFNVGFFDYYSQYAAVYQGERYPKALHRAGFRRGIDASGNDKRLEEIDLKMERVTKDLNTDQEKDEAQRAALSDEDRKFLNEYNNLPIFSLGGTRGLESLENIARGFEKGGLVVNGKAEPGDRDPRLWSIYDDVGDFFGGDLAGADQTASMMVDPLNGFMWEPNIDKIGAVLTVHEGRKRMWQRSKLAHDLAESMLEFRGTLNKKLKKVANWNASMIDLALTEMRQARFFDEGAKKRLEEEVYPKVTPAWEKALTLGFTRSPFLHKLIWVYGKNTVEPLIFGAFVGLKELIARLTKAFGTTLNSR